MQRPLVPCDLAACHGTCCHDGVYLNPDEARFLASPHLAAALRPFAVDLPEDPVVPGSDGTSQGPKTATVPRPMRRLAHNYPAHFPETACVFLTPDARCSLQLLAAAENRHPWDYKPFTCWMHPLSLTRDPSQRPVLTLHDAASDPQRRPGYPGFVPFTPCGATCPGAAPAWRTLESELRTLGTLAQRDFLAELAALPSDSGDPRRDAQQ